MFNLSTSNSKMAVLYISPSNGIFMMLRKIFWLSLPFLMVLGSYFVLDPFRVLYQYPTYQEPMAAIPNRDYISTQMYLNTYKKQSYKSFILGNSRTMAYHIRDWEPYIQDTIAFHYDASGESLFGLWKKLQFLEQHHSALKNVLIICDAELLEKTKDYETHILRKDPRTLGDYPIGFQLAFIKAYFSDNFFYKYIKNHITGNFTPDMEEVLERRRIYYDPFTNDLLLPDINQEIKKDSLGYYARNKRLKIIQKPSVSKAVIGAIQLQQLVAIHNILMRHQTNYQIVISPLFNQHQLNPSDLTTLQRLFGTRRIHDFSGVNEFTTKVSNYYEESHYRPLVGRAILKQVYAPAE